MEIDTRYINQIEVIVNIFTIINGKLKILLAKKDDEPFKGHWMLPSNLLMTTETIEECANYTINQFSGYDNLPLFYSNINSKIDRLPNDRIIANSLIAILDSVRVNRKKEKRNIVCEWFDINEIPKTVYDHGEMIKEAIKNLKLKIQKNELIDIFYPNDFTLPELQSIYEQAFDKILDRRNFRKKMLKLNILEDTGYKNNNGNGRPPKLYRFKNEEFNF